MRVMLDDRRLARDGGKSEHRRVASRITTGRTQVRRQVQQKIFLPERVKGEMVRSELTGADGDIRGQVNSSWCKTK